MRDILTVRIHFRKWTHANCRPAPRQIRQEADQQVVLGRVLPLDTPPNN